MGKNTTQKENSMSYQPYTSAEIKWAMIELARQGEVATRTKAINYIDECKWGTSEEQAAMHEAEMFAEFGSSWVHGGGDPSDVSIAWAQHRAAYMAGAIG
jgi:hypothetical protein